MTGKTVDGATDALIQDFVEKDHFSGVVLISRRGRVLHKCAYGPASAGRSNRVDDRFHVASVTKQFTAAAIMRLVEEGTVELDGQINGYLPEIYRSEYWEAINVIHLLSHASGLPDYAVSRDYYHVVDGWALGRTLEGMIREAMECPPDFLPGSRFCYCNLGYTLLGKIIEARTGSRYADYVKNELLAPLGMADTEIHDERYISKPNDVSGLRWDETLARHIRDDVLSLPVTPADGGLVTTLDDFARWVSIYRDMSHPGLSKAALEVMLRQASPTAGYRWPEQGMRGEAFYGLGLMRSGDLLMHEGSIVGFRSYFIYSRNDDMLITVFSNNTHNDVFRLAKGLFRLHDASA